MFIKNATYKTVSTEGQTFPIVEGTIISNGIVPQTIYIDPPTHRISVAIGGTIDLKSEANKNVSFTDEQILALGADFDFIPGDEEQGSFVLDCTGSDGVTVEVSGAYVEINFPDIDPAPLIEAANANKLCMITVGAIYYDEDEEDWVISNDSPANVVLTLLPKHQHSYYDVCGIMSYAVDNELKLAQVHFSFMPDEDVALPIEIGS